MKDGIFNPSVDEESDVFVSEEDIGNQKRILGTRRRTCHLIFSRIKNLSCLNHLISKKDTKI